MGQSSSTTTYSAGTCPSLSRRLRPSKSVSSSMPTALSPFDAPDLPLVLLPPPPLPPPHLDLLRDNTADLPDECLALVFQFLNSAERNRCSLVCRRWLSVEGRCRHRLSLDSRAALLEAAPSIFKRFDSVSKLALKCHRHADSIGDDALELISLHCPLLTRLKIRSCRLVTDVGMTALANNCKKLRKLSCGSCVFGAKGVSAVVSLCPLLEELSIKRLRGLTDVTADQVAPPARSSLRSICLKDLYNGQCLVPLIAGSSNLKTLKLFRCSGNWDVVLEQITGKVPALFEVHIEKLQVSNRGLSALTKCISLEVFHLVKTPECTDIGLISVAEHCHLLRKIHIDGWKMNRIGDESLSAVARHCPNLQELVLIGVNPTSVSIGLIANNCRNLERLALCASETIGDAELLCIASKCLALKKLCIKGCNVSDQGIEALAGGCPNLVKVKVKKCKNVTMEVAELLRVTRGMLAVSLDADSPGMAEQLDSAASDRGMQENGAEQIPPLVSQVSAIDIPSSSSGCSTFSKARQGLLTGRNFMASTFRRWSNSSSSQH